MALVSFCCVKPRELVVGLTVWQKALEGVCGGEVWRDWDLQAHPQLAGGMVAGTCCPLTTAGLCFKTCSVKQPEPTEPESVLTVLDVQLVSVSCAQVCSSILLFFLVDTSLKERTTEMLCACSSSPCVAYGQVRACHCGVMFV